MAEQSELYAHLSSLRLREEMLAQQAHILGCISRETDRCMEAHTAVSHWVGHPEQVSAERLEALRDQARRADAVVVAWYTQLGQVEVLIRSVEASLAASPALCMME